MFPVSIHILVDLIQQTYHSQAPTRQLDSPQGSDVGPVLYFCTLREALLNSFLTGNLRAKQIPEPLIDKLLDDNKLAGQKFGGLFSSVVGDKWPDAVANVSQKVGTDYSVVSSLMKAAAERRNEFLHSGRAWLFTRDFAGRCVDATGELLSLFAELHNEYTRPLIRVTSN